LLNSGPVLWRELQAASRRGSTRHLRLWTAILGLGVGLVTYLMLQMTRLTGGSGGNHFFVFAGYTLLICLVAGVFLTADSISQERREGTLGLLFLSGLGSWDVLAGKLAATGVAALYAVLGLVPLMAIPVLAGGVTGGELARMALVLANGLWYAVTVGLLASVLVREAGRSMLLALVTMGAACLSVLWWARAAPLLADLAPVTAFVRAGHGTYTANPAAFWQALGGSHAVGWGLFLAAGLVLRRSWQNGQSEFRWPRALIWLNRFGQTRHTSRPDDSPIVRLAHPGRFGVYAPWMVVLLGTLPIVLLTGVMGQMTFARIGLWPVAFLLKAIIAYQACRFFAEARRDGTLELLLGTPLTDKEILSGHWALLRRLYFAPVLAYTLINIILGTGMLFSDATTMIFLMITTVFSMGSFLVDCVAAGVVGTWLALTLRKPQFAFGATVLFALLLPSLLCGVGFISNLILLAVAASRLTPGIRALSHKAQT
jgi:ABC-type transport system involved in multi-copper enzyme maturation permease subunit